VVVVKVAVGVEKCPECGCSVVLNRQGELVCSSCGLVVEGPLLDQGPEWRAYTLEERIARSRAGPPSPPGVGVRSTSIGLRKDLYYNPSLKSDEKRARASKLMASQFWMRTAEERAINEFCAILKSVSVKLSLSKAVEDEALLIFKRAHERKLTAGHPIEAWVVACVYAACRVLRTPKRFDEILKATPRAFLDELSKEKGRRKKPWKKEVTRCYRLLIMEGFLTTSSLPRPQPEDYVSIIASRLGLRGEVARRALELVERARELGLTSGRDPATIAAAAVYLAGLLVGGAEHVTQREIAKAIGVSEVGLRNRARELAKKLNLDLELRGSLAPEPSTTIEVLAKLRRARGRRRIAKQGERPRRESEESVKVLAPRSSTS
jgi:transcription initiation factor TFIIB